MGCQSQLIERPALLAAIIPPTCQRLGPRAAGKGARIRASREVVGILGEKGGASNPVAHLPGPERRSEIANAALVPELIADDRP
jgi:hypothetical protein